MTDTDIERLVSETIEPMPAKLITAVIAYRGDVWRYDDGAWLPAPWLTDDRYTMRLFDEMPEPVLIHDGGKWECGLNVIDIRYEGWSWDEGGTDKDRRRAIVFAWLKAKGVPIES